MSPQGQLSFEPMSVMDLDDVAAIEQRSYPFPWTYGVFVDSLAAGYRAWVARDGDLIIGYALMMVVLDEVHLLNITIAPERQGNGLGKTLLNYLFDDARAQGTRFMFLEVRPSNAAAIEMYYRFGFMKIGERRGYYPAAYGREDAIVMSRDLEKETMTEKAA
jgi:[ribosomal protein S18]-alanine N-acetyltransferase